jgi:hypothetical protein
MDKMTPEEDEFICQRNREEQDMYYKNLWKRKLKGPMMKTRSLPKKYQGDEFDTDELDDTVRSVEELEGRRLVNGRTSGATDLGMYSESDTEDGPLPDSDTFKA